VFRQLAWIALTCLLVVCGLVPARQAHAQAPASQTLPQTLPLELEWGAPAECPSATEVRSELERIARVVPGFNLPPLVARAQVERRDNAYRVQLSTELAGQKGERTLDATDCNTLMRTVTLVLALAFGRGVEVQSEPEPRATSATGAAATRSPPGTARPQEAQPEALSPAASQADTVEPGSQQASGSEPHADAPLSREAPTERAHEAQHEAAHEPHSVRWSLMLGGGAQLALLPGAALALSAGAELEAGAALVALRIAGWPGVSQALATDVDARFDGLATTLQGCGQLSLDAFGLAVCGGARAAVVRGRATGAAVLNDERGATAPWYALQGAAALTWPSNRMLRLRVEGALAASLNRPRFVIEALRQAHRVPLLAPEVSLLLLLSL
jgi:hypothetical protein